MISRRDTGYVAAADVLRVLCIALVAWFHLWQQSWLNPCFRLGGVYFDVQRIVRRGYLGVDLMLLLSGFLLYLPCARQSAESPLKIDVSVFYHKRLFRILPSYLLAVLTAFFFALFTGCEAGSAPLWRDLLAHLTLTQTFSQSTYAWTSLNVALWTIAVEMQFYLIFPWLAKCFSARPWLTTSGMISAAVLCRCIIFPLSDVSLYFNQLPCMLDVYAFGMLSAHLVSRSADKKSWLFVPASLAALFLIFRIFWLQGSISSLDIQHHQIIWRLPLAAAGALFLYSGARWPSGFSRIIGNPVTRFLSAISYNFYIWHQYLAVRLKKWHIPNYLSQMPQKDEGVVWQRKYFWLSLAVAFVLAALLTYLMEIPVYKKCLRLYKKKTASRT